MAAVFKSIGASISKASSAPALKALMSVKILLAGGIATVGAVVLLAFRRRSAGNSAQLPAAPPVKKKPRKRRKPVYTRRERVVSGLRLAGLIMATLGLVAFALWRLDVARQVESVRIVAENPKSAGFLLAQALKSVVERHYPKVAITVSESAGDPESLQRLRSDSAQLAVVSAGFGSVPPARTIAVLFSQPVQILVHSTAPAATGKKPGAASAAAITTFAGLKNRKIGLVPQGPQYASFLSLAAYFGFKAEDFSFDGGDDTSAGTHFVSKEADALFRVAPLNDPAIAGVVASLGAGNGRFLPLEQGSSLHLRDGSFIPAVIPAGAYSADPPFPAEAVPTVQVEKLLLCRDNTPAAVVQAIANVVTTYKGELAAAIPGDNGPVRNLVSQIAQPATNPGLNPPVHESALALYQHRPQPFLAAWGDLLLFGLSLAALIPLWVFLIRSRPRARRLSFGRQYTMRVTQVMENAGKLEFVGRHGVLKTELLRILSDAIQDFEDKELTAAQFQDFQSVWKSAMDLVNEREGAWAVPAATPAPLPVSAEGPRARSTTLAAFLGIVPRVKA